MNALQLEMRDTQQRLGSVLLNFLLALLLATLSILAPAHAAGYTVNTTSTPSPLTGLWGNANEPGWSLSLTQQDEIVFVGWYAYRPDGTADWYVMSNCAVTSNTCAGDIYHVTGGSSPNVPWTGSSKAITKVGSGSLAFSDDSAATFSYSLNGVNGFKSIARQIFGRGTAPPTMDHSGLWGNTDEPGWGVSLTQQLSTIVSHWFTYDAAGKPIWYVASNCTVNAAGNGCTGDWYQVSGCASPMMTWNCSKKAVTKVGSVSFSFANSDASATMNYTLNGTSGTKTIAQQVFSSSGTVDHSAAFNLAQTLSDEAQRTTLAFSGLAIITGNLDAQSFFPPGKVADYTGFQYLRDNDPDNMGHNTSFLTRVANNVIYILTDGQLAQLKTLASAQIDQVNLYGYKRYPLMQSFRRLIDGTIPIGSAGLNLNAVKKASRELYLIDGQISFDRAVLYAKIINSLDASQKAHLDAMKGKGWNSWPDITDSLVRGRMAGLAPGTATAIMTYASDIYSWYAGSLDADVYFCPERHGTYYGGFYIKDAPAVGHEGYSISEQLTVTAGAALSDSSKGYVTQEQATLIANLVAAQRDNLYAGASTNIVDTRRQIATLLRSLLSSPASTDAIRAQVLALSGTYGELDGTNNHGYATTFAQVYKTLTSAQKAQFTALRKSIMSGKYADGTVFDYSVATTPFLYADVITNESLLTSYIGNTDYLFFEP